jgi:hypothetical protein
LGIENRKLKIEKILSLSKPATTTKDYRVNLIDAFNCN